VPDVRPRALPPECRPFKDTKHRWHSQEESARLSRGEPPEPYASLIAPSPARESIAGTVAGRVPYGGVMESHPWREISLEVYEAHMCDTAVGQLGRLREITAYQLRDRPSRSIGILGVAGETALT